MASVSKRGAAQGQPIPGFDKSQCGYTFGGVGRAPPADAEILVAAGDSILENSPVDSNVAASVTQARPSGSIREVALKTTTVTAERRLFHPNETGDVPIIEFRNSLAEQILKILNTGVAEKVDAVGQAERTIRRRDELVVGEAALHRPSPLRYWGAAAMS
jgi:hypothetical protein